MLSGLYSAWLAEVVLITYRATRSGSNEGTQSIPLPLPAQYASTFIIYGALGLIPPSGQRFAAIVGWGFVVATLLNFWNPNGSVRLTAANTKATAPGGGPAPGPVPTVGTSNSQIQSMPGGQSATIGQSGPQYGSSTQPVKAT